MGIPTWDSSTKLVRINIKDPPKYNPRLPNPSMQGANAEFVVGGLTPGGLHEITIDAVPTSLISVHVLK